MPHVYMTNQNPNLPDAVNPLGRWDYGPWIWPPFPSDHPPIELPDGTLGFGLDGAPDLLPNLPDISMGMEAFFDTPVVNGTVYPVLDVQPKTYRFRILNAANDRFVNLQLHEATSIISGITITNAGSGYTTPFVITPALRYDGPRSAFAIAAGALFAITVGG
jgi:FtsP/CotA-like multicopper oxidase with cupredoxin domain